MTRDALTLRQLNRAGLDRQFLLARVERPVEATVGTLCGMQGQAPNAPYVGLWSRHNDFDPTELAAGLLAKRLVRAPLLRGTVHLIGADDATAWYPLVKPVLARGFASNFARRLPGVDIDKLMADCAQLLTEPLTRQELGRALAPRWPDQDKMAMAYAATFLLPLVQVPPRGVWGENAQATWLNMGTWLGDVGTPDPTPENMIIRYLTAFGPATVRDIQAWCGLTRLREVVERLPLRRYEGGLFDIADGTIPDPDTPAPPRFLPEYDNLLLSYADRARVGGNEHAVPLPPGVGGNAGTLLVDGYYAANWELRRDADDACLLIDAFRELTRADTAAVLEEGVRLLGFIAADAQRRDVTITSR